MLKQPKFGIMKTIKKCSSTNTILMDLRWFYEGFSISQV